MTEDVEVMREKPSNACCAALQKKHSKLLEKYSKVEELKNRFRNCTELLQGKYDVIEKENGSLKKAIEELKVQASMWKDEKEKESGIRVDLEDEVSALREEVQLLKCDGSSASREENEQLQGQLNEANKEIKKLKELLDKERKRAVADKKNIEIEKKKADEDIEVQLLKCDGSTASREENEQLQRQLNEANKENEQLQGQLNEANKEIKNLKELLDKERKRAAADKKNIEIEKKKADEDIEVLLKRDGSSASREENEQLQGQLNEANKEIKKLKELLDKERKRAVADKKNIEIEKKKADEALKKLEMEKNKVSEVQKTANIERKRAEENWLMWEKLKVETDAVTEIEKKKADKALKKLEMEKNKVSEVQKRVNIEQKRAEENRLMWEKLKVETDAVKSKLALEKSKVESASKKVEDEKQNTIKERKRADLAVAKAEEQRQLAETNLKKAMFEKDRADDLNGKFEEASNRAKKLEELQRVLCSGKSVGTQANISCTGRNAKLAIEDGVSNVKDDAAMSQWMKKMLLEKEQTIVREKRQVDSEKKIAKKQRKIAKAYKKKAWEQKNLADKLSKELESCKLRLAEVETELVKSSRKTCVKNSSLRYDNTISETDIVKQLRNQLNREKMIVKSAKEASQVEALRNNLLHQELLQLKQEFLQLQLRMSMLDNCFSQSGVGTRPLKKLGNYTSTGETLFLDDCHEQLTSGINSELEPPHRGSIQTMLQSSAINSSSTSISDRPLMGSQERGTFSIASTKLVEDISNIKPAIPRLSKKSRIRHNEHVEVNADSLTRNLVKENAHRSKLGCSERKRILDAVKSLENLYCKGEKLHDKVSGKLSLLNVILSDQKDKPKGENLNDASCRDLDRPSKRRKISSDGTVVTHCLLDSEVSRSMLDTHADLRPAACVRASPQGICAIKFDPHKKDGTNNSRGNICKPQDFIMMAGYDYMKLLDLDDPAAEAYYRKAIAMPLSPLRADFESHEDAKLEVGNHQMLLKENSQDELTDFMDGMLPSSKFHVNNLEVEPINVVLNRAVSSRTHGNEDSIDILTSKDSTPAGSKEIHQILLDGKSRTSDLIDPSSKEINVPCERGIASLHDDRLRYYVLFSDNKDNPSILRILQAIGTCLPNCSSLDSADILIQTIIHSLLKTQDLSMREKVCVFFSLVLHRISEVGIMNLSNALTYDSIQSLDSVTLRICSALTNLVLRRKLKESCDLLELLALIEDFILRGKVFVIADESAHLEAVSSFRLDVLNGDVIVLSEVVATGSLLVAGASMFASLCSAVDHVGCVCEISCNIVTMQICDASVMLSILHSFAHICGSKYFALQQYSLLMTVIKSLVMFHERRAISTNSTPISFPCDGNISKVWSCGENCPFLEGAVSVEDVAVMLLENLCKHNQSASLPQDSFDVVNTLFCRGGLNVDIPEGVLGFGDVSSDSTFDEKFCSFVDVLSLIELVAASMSWNWTFDHIVAQICEFLESCVMEGFYGAVIVLLGQLGRLGVHTSGYEDPEVKKLREWLSAFLCKDPFKTSSLPAQFATVTSLFALTPTKFNEVIEGAAVTSQYIPAGFIREWFSHLNPEHQSLFKLSLDCICE